MNPDFCSEKDRGEYENITKMALPSEPQIMYTLVLFAIWTSRELIKTTRPQVGDSGDFDQDEAVVGMPFEVNDSSQVVNAPPTFRTQGLALVAIAASAPFSDVPLSHLGQTAAPPPTGLDLCTGFHGNAGVGFTSSCPSGLRRRRVLIWRQL